MENKRIKNLAKMLLKLAQIQDIDYEDKITDYIEEYVGYVGKLNLFSSEIEVQTSPALKDKVKRLVATSMSIASLLGNDPLKFNLEGTDFIFSIAKDIVSLKKDLKTNSKDLKSIKTVVSSHDEDFDQTDDAVFDLLDEVSIILCGLEVDELATSIGDKVSFYGAVYTSGDDSCILKTQKEAFDDMDLNVDAEKSNERLQNASVLLSLGDNISKNVKELELETEIDDPTEFEGEEAAKKDVLKQKGDDKNQKDFRASSGRSRAEFSKFLEYAQKKLTKLKELKIKLDKNQFPLKTEEVGNVTSNLNKLETDIKNFEQLLYERDYASNTNDANTLRSKTEEIQSLRKKMNYIYTILRYRHDKVNTVLNFNPKKIVSKPREGDTTPESWKAYGESLIEWADSWERELNLPDYVDGDNADEPSGDKPVKKKYFKNIIDSFTRDVKILSDRISPGSPVPNDIISGFEKAEKVKQNFLEKIDYIAKSFDATDAAYYIDGQPTMFSNLSKLSGTVNDYFGGSGHFYMQAFYYFFNKAKAKDSKNVQKYLASPIEGVKKGGVLVQRINYLIAKRAKYLKTLEELAVKLSKNESSKEFELELGASSKGKSKRIIPTIISEIRTITAALIYVEELVDIQTLKGLHETEKQALVLFNSLMEVNKNLVPMNNADRVARKIDQIQAIAGQSSQVARSFVMLLDKLSEQESLRKQKSQAFANQVLGIKQSMVVKNTKIEITQDTMNKVDDLLAEAERLFGTKLQVDKSKIEKKVEEDKETSVYHNIFTKNISNYNELEILIAKELSTQSPIKKTVLNIQESIRELQEATVKIKEIILSGLIGSFTLSDSSSELGKGYKNKVERSNNKFVLKVSPRYEGVSKAEILSSLNGYYKLLQQSLASWSKINTTFKSFAAELDSQNYVAKGGGAKHQSLGLIIRNIDVLKPKIESITNQLSRRIAQIEKATEIENVVKILETPINLPK